MAEFITEESIFAGKYKLKPCPGDYTKQMLVGKFKKPENLKPLPPDTTPAPTHLSPNPCVRAFGPGPKKTTCATCIHASDEKHVHDMQKENKVITGIACAFRAEAGFPYSIWPDTLQACSRWEPK